MCDMSKKKVLFINNYDMVAMKDKVIAKTMPSHHMWGMFEIEKLGFNVEIIPINFKIAKQLTSYIYQFILTLQILFFKRGYDIVYAACKHLTDVLAVLKLCKLYRKKIVMVAHHPQSIWFVGGYDKIIFFSADIFEKVKKKHPKHAHKFEFVFWGPDVEFYNYWTAKVNRTEKGEDIFISNGCTFRDLECFEDSVKKVNCNAILVSDKPVNDSVSQKAKENPKIDLQITGKRYHEFKNNKKSDNGLPALLEFYFKASYIVIPLQADIVNLAGFTGIWDAFCLNKPMIISDNSSTGIPFVENNLALVYKAGSVDDLAEKMEYVLQHKIEVLEMASNAKRYAIENDINMFAQKLADIFKAL